ncbi:RidA family protein [Chitinibacteraceae bacterium HSL-7]
MSASVQRYQVGPRLSEIVVHNNTVYLSGQVAFNVDGTTATQTTETLMRIDQLLDSVGSSRHKLLSVTIYLADISDYDAMNDVWTEWVAPGSTPARTTVEAKLADPRYKVEISVVAAL